MKPTRNPVSGEGEVLSFASLPLWQWAATKPHAASPFNWPALRIAAKARISLPHAAIVAELMGYPTEASQ